MPIASNRLRLRRALLAIVPAAAIAAAVWWLGHPNPIAGQLSVDPAALIAKTMVLALALPVLLMSRHEFEGGEFPALLLSSLYGVCLLQSADSFLTMFLGLEIMSLPVYALVLLAYRRPQSAEAALKCLVLGLLAVLPLLSIIWGNLVAMRQQSIRRMIAYSSIAHAGYLFYAMLGAPRAGCRQWPSTCWPTA